MRADYRVDLDKLMRLYVNNYVLLERLIPQKAAVGALFSLKIAGKTGYVLQYIERTRYTSLIEIKEQNAPLANGVMVQMRVRLYHDASLAEVCASQQIYRFKPRYDYPNRRMLQRDEKYQVNQLLNDWLWFCIKQQVIIEPVTGSGKK